MTPLRERAVMALEAVAEALKPLATCATQQLKERDEYNHQRQRDYRTYKLKSQPGGTCCLL